MMLNIFSMMYKKWMKEGSVIAFKSHPIHMGTVQKIKPRTIVGYVIWDKSGEERDSCVNQWG